MKLKFAYLFVLSCILSHTAIAQSAEDYLKQGMEAYKKDNFTQAAQLFEKACNGGQDQACLNLSKFYKHGTGVKQNSNKADELFKKGIENRQKECNSKKMDACERLADAYYEDNDFNHATPLYENVCNSAGNPRSCQNAAAAYLTEEGVNRDLNKAYQYAKKGCDQKAEESCRVLNVVKDIQNDKDHDTFSSKCVLTKDNVSCLKHIFYLEKLCNENKYGACYMLALEYDHNPVQAVRTDKEKAYQLYKKACKGMKKIPEYNCEDFK